tara:strand:+ start:36 stop:599 length:564 start_codon:yes stop_codon:yes gene_type:complete
MIERYKFDVPGADIRSLIPLIGTHGKNLIGCELGTFKAQSMLAVLQALPNVKLMYGVDAFQPYEDHIATDYYSRDQKEMEIVKFLAYHNIKYSGVEDRVKMLEMTTNKALSKIKNNKLDFIFIDSYLSYEQAYKEITDWYCKVKKGGIYAGHDARNPTIMKALHNFLKDNKIKNSVVVWDDTWVFIK